jgi:putative heme-binding domain-containing protein
MSLAMRIAVPFIWTLCVLACVANLGSVRGDGLPNTTQIGAFNFTLAAGLEIEKVADESLIQWPIAATYDDHQDLLVLECHWNREPVQKQLESRPHKIVRLADTNNDGTYDKRTVIADSLGFPEGIMVFGKDLLVTTPPQILRLSDRDGDGFYESKEVWFDGATLTHCANDLHGPMLGPDGWVYWTKGAFAEQNHELIRRESQVPLQSQSKAAHIYRRHPKGGPIERLMTGGMDNPSDITFSPEGEIFFCSTFLHNPGNGLRDGIAHAPRGGLFGKQHQVIDGHWSTGPLLEPIANLGPAAPASVHYLQSDTIPRATPWFKDSQRERFLISAQFNLQKIGIHRLVPQGASFTTETFDLVTADRIDFHPVDILEESDGGLLVFDTGGWYDLCCPSSGSDQSIAKGGIYRLKTQKRDGGKSGVAKAATKEPIDLRKEQLWELARQVTRDPSAQSAKKSIMAMLGDQDPSVRQTATHIVSLNRWNEASGSLEQLLASESPQVVRAAMEALGVVGDSHCVPAILSALTRFSDDRYIQHSCIYALMEIGAIEETVQIAIKTRDDLERYAALHALDQLKKLPDDLLPILVDSLASSNGKLRELALRSLASHPQGVAMCLPFLESAWTAEDASKLETGLPILQIGHSNLELQSVVSKWLSQAPQLSDIKQKWLLKAVKQMRANKLPSEWSAAIGRWLDSGPDAMLVSIADALQNAALLDQDKELISKSLRNRAEGSIGKPEIAVALLASCPSTTTPLSEACSILLVQQVTAPESALANQAERALSRVVISQSAAERLVQALGEVAPLQLQSCVDALLSRNDSKLDAMLLKQLPALPAVKTLSQERLMSKLSGRSEGVQKDWAMMMQEATRPPADVSESLDSWLARLPAGDAARGYQVFRSPKAACSTCHQVGYIGGRLGPELSHIGKSRTRRDLVESVVFPSFRMAQGYYPVRIRTESGEVFNGIVSKQTDSQVEIVCGADKTYRIDRSDIEEFAESKVSVMPNGLDQQMSLQEFADLLVFLESKK